MLIVSEPKSYKPIYILEATGLTVSEDIKFSNQNLNKTQDFENAFSVYIPAIDKKFRFVARNTIEKAKWYNDFKIVETQNRFRNEIDRTRVGKVKPKWIPDVLCKSCCQCNSEFTAINRRHHCRACGYVYCSRCSEMLTILPFYDSKPKRVCDICHDKINPYFLRKAPSISYFDF